MSQRSVLFRVRASTTADELLCLSGSCPELGEWSFDKALTLNRGSQDGEETNWSVDVRLPLDQVSYRYLLCTRLPSYANDQNKTVIKKWETALIARSVTPTAGDDTVVRDDGTFGKIDGRPIAVDNGHLCSQSELQMRIAFSSESPIRIFNADTPGWLIDPERCSILVHPHWMPSQQNCFPRDSHLPVTVKRFSSSRSEPSFEEHLQHCHGEPYHLKDILVFSIQTFDFPYLALKVDILMRSMTPSDGVSGDVCVVASTCLIASQLNKSRDRLVLPLVDKAHLPVGQLEVHCLIVHPYGGPLSLKKSYSRYWNRQRKTLDVGHRGMGSSMKISKNLANITENSVSSFRNAARHGADYIEFDVQLTQDHEVVIYHDFVFKARVEKLSSGGEPLIHEVALCNLTFDMLSSIAVVDDLKLESKQKAQEDLSSTEMFEADGSDKSSSRSRSESIGSETHLSVPEIERKSSATSVESLDLALPDSALDTSPFFPKLEEVFKEVSASVGFNIELKFPDSRWDPVSVCNRYFDINDYVDTILKVVFSHANRRRIIFSCFDADVCTCLRLKQSHYPVVFLTMGSNRDYTTNDLRLRYLHTASLFAKSQQLLGVGISSEEVTKNQQQVQGMLNDGLVVITWGQGNNDAENIELQQSIGVHAIIHDKMSKSGKTRNVFVEEHHRARVSPITSP